MTGIHSRFIGREQGSKLFALAFLAAVWVVLAWPWLSGSVTIPWDAKAQFLPQLQFLSASFARGESPAWNPYAFSGMPQIADPQSLIFSPPYLLMALFNPAPTPWAADVTLYAMLLVSAAAMLVWLTDKGWHAAAALLSSVAFAFGAAMAWRIQHIGQVMSLAYLPVTLLFLDRALSRRSWAWSLAAGIAAGFLVLGRDQVALLSVYFLIAYVISGWLCAPQSGVAVRQSIAPLFIAGVAGLAVVCIPVILTALVAAESNRPSIDLEGAGRGSLHPALFLTFLAPDVFGATGHYGEYWGPPSGRWKDTGLYIAQNMGQMYLGALPAVLVIWGLVTGVLWRNTARVFTLSLAFAMLYGLGWYTPAFGWMHALIPGVDLYRRPADAVFIMGFLASVLAGFTLNELLSEPLPRLWPWQKLMIFAIPSLAFAIMIALAVHFDKLSDDWPAIAVPVLLICAAAVLLASLAGKPVPAKTAVLAVAAFMGADLAYSNAPGGATGLPLKTYDVLEPATPNTTIALLKQKTGASLNDTRRDRVEIVGFGFHWPNASLTHGLENTLGYNPLRLGLYTRATGAGDHVGLPEQKGFSPLFPSYRSRLADLLGLRYIATSVPVDQIDKNLRPGDLMLVSKTDDGYVYENPRALPRVMFATESRHADFDPILVSGSWPDFDPEKTVLLEHGRPIEATSATASGTARIVAYHNTEVTLEADSTSGGFVVLNDVWHPWWFATVDGVETPIGKANVLFRAVPAPAGKHSIRFTFEPLRGAFNQLKATWKK